jgi:hypothetical protein
MLRTQIFVLILALLPSLSSAQGKNPPTNLDFMRGAIWRTLDSSLSKTSLNSPLELVAEGENEANWLLEDVLLSWLLKRGEEVSLKGNAPLSALLSFRILGLQLSYPAQRRRGFLGPRQVKREAEMDFILRLQAPDERRVLWNRRIRGRIFDWISRAKLKSTKASPYPFLTSPLPSGGWARYGEPIVVTGLVAGLVYLLYSNR